MKEEIYNKFTINLISFILLFLPLESCVEASGAALNATNECKDAHQGLTLRPIVVNHADEWRLASCVEAAGADLTGVNEHRNDHQGLNGQLLVNHADEWRLAYFHDHTVGKASVPENRESIV